MKLLLMLLISCAGYPYNIDIYDSPSEKNKSVVIVIDDLDKEHKLIIENDKLDTNCVEKWIDQLIEEGKLYVR